MTMIVAALIASLIMIEWCRYCTTRNREPSMWHAAGVSFATALVMLLVAYDGELFTLRFWTEGKAPMTILVPGFVAACTLILLAPTAAVVWYFRTIFD